MNPLDDEVLHRVAASNPVPVLDDQALDPAAVTLRDRIVCMDQSAPTKSAMHRRRKAIIGGGVAGVVVLGGVAAATGLVPAGVSHRLERVTPRGDAVVGVTMVAEHVSPNGVRDQIWLGHLRRGGQPCELIRTVAPADRALPDPVREDGSVGCGILTPGSPTSLGVPISPGGEPAGRPWPALTYNVIVRADLPAAVRMDATYPGGRSYPVSYNRRTGWAIGVAPPEVTTLDGVLVVRDARNAVLTREPLPRTTIGR